LLTSWQVRGVAKSSFGMNVALLAGVPPQVIEQAARKSHELQAQLEHGGVERVLESEQVSAVLQATAASDVARLQALQLQLRRPLLS
jgi:DNA mismatch repair ATPase MutS